MMDIDKEIYKVIDREGGFVNDPDDPGGATKYGITISTLTDHVGHFCTVEDVKNLDKKTAYEIYYRKYYLKTGVNSLPMSLQPIMLDMCVNPGTSAGPMMLQDVLIAYGYSCGRKDGKIGKKTTAAAHSAFEELGNQIIRALVNRRVIYYEKKVKENPVKRKYLSGWITRAESFMPEKAA